MEYTKCLAYGNCSINSCSFPFHGGQFYVMDIKSGFGIRKTADGCVNLGKEKTLSLFPHL